MRANIREKQRVSRDIKKAWTSQFKKTRLIDIANGSGLNIMTVSDAISKGMATDRTIEKINNYAQQLQKSNIIQELLIDIRDREYGLISINAGNMILKPESMQLSWLKVLQDDVIKNPEVTEKYFGKSICDRLKQL